MRQCVCSQQQASDLTLLPNFGSVSSVNSRINEAESQRTRKKDFSSLAYVSHFNSAYNPQGELAHRQLSSANREGLFFDKVYSDSHALIDSLAICMKTFTYAWIRIREYVSHSLSTPNKRATESSTVLPSELIDDGITIEDVSSIALSKSNRYFIEEK